MEHSRRAHTLGHILCRYCRYDLAGIAARDGSWICPECGESTPVVIPPRPDWIRCDWRIPLALVGLLTVCFFGAGCLSGRFADAVWLTQFVILFPIPAGGLLNGLVATVIGTRVDRQCSQSCQRLLPSLARAAIVGLIVGIATVLASALAMYLGATLVERVVGTVPPSVMG